MAPLDPNAVATPPQQSRPASARLGALASRLADAARRDAMVLAPHRRGARNLRRLFDNSMRAAGHRQWAPLPVLPFDGWLQACWSDLLLRGKVERPLLNSTQEAALWQRVILADLLEHNPGEVSAGRGAASLAAEAASAWKLIWQAGGHDRLRECGTTTEGAAFLRWAQAFERRCTREQMLSPAELPRALQASAEAGELDLAPGGLLLVDCDELPAASRQLLATLEQAGWTVEHTASTLSGGTGSLWRAADDADELLACARALRGRLETRPEQRITVVVPRLAERRAAIDRVFAQHLAEPLRLQRAPGEALYEFAMGVPLAETMLAKTAMALLRWTRGPLPLEIVSLLLLSPFFAGSGEAAGGAAEFDAFELRTRTVLRPELSLPAMIAAVRSKLPAYRLTDLLGRLRALEKSANERFANDGTQATLPLPETFARCTDRFRILLAAAGCRPQEHAAAVDDELFRQFESALDEVATLDFDSPDRAGEAPVTFEAALDALARVLGSSIFSPAPTHAPVEVLRPLDVGCEPFDVLWFLGADDLALPPGRPAHVLLPWRLQQSLGLPGTDRMRTRDEFARLTRRLAGSAAEVVFSYAGVSEDGEQRRASPLLAELALQPLLPAQPPAPDEASPYGKWTEVLDPQPVPLRLGLLRANENPDAGDGAADARLRGGATLFELQAACAFRAFAELRLASRGLKDRTPGLHAGERGTLVHTTMEQFWKQVQDQGQLKALSDGERTAVLEDAIERALARARAGAESPWDHAYLRAQRARLHRLLGPWLVLESSRPPFAVLQQETRLQGIELGGLRLGELRVDRIDETEAGLMLIDYKTGPANPAGWLGERPEAPQLPLYAVLAASEQFAETVFAGQQLAAVAFAELRAGDELTMRGFSDDPHAFPGRKTTPMAQPSLPEQVEDWRRVLDALADAYAAGEAEVLPLSYPRTCQYCDQRLLCRLDPATLGTDDDDDRESGGASAYDAGEAPSYG